MDTSLAPIDLDDLAKRVSVLLDPDALLDADDVGRMLKCSGRHVLEWHAKSESFPTARRFQGPGGVKGHPRWRRCDIVEYIRGETTPKRPGRPRRGVTS